MDGTNNQELEYYRKQCNELGRHVLHLQAEKTLIRRDAARNRMLVELVSNAYRLESGLTRSNDIERPCLQVILNAMQVDCAALMQFIPDSNCFQLLSALGFPGDLPTRFTPPMVPGENYHISSGTPPHPLADSMRRYSGVPFLLWAFEPRAGLALMVGNKNEDQHLHRPFNEKDYKIVRTALIVFIDIEDRISSKKALLNSEEKYRLLVENANDAIFVVQDGRIEFANSKMARMTGYEHSELIGVSFAELIHPADRNQANPRHIEPQHEDNPPSQHAFRIVKADEQVLWIDLNTVIIEWEKRPATLNFARDITRQIHLEKQLRNAQKMEAIGTLAGGIAHDFNNILSAIIGYTDLAALILPEDEPARSSLNEVMNAAQRAKELVYRILSFSQMHEQEHKPVRMDLIIQEALKLLRPSLPSTIVIEQHIDCQGAILADPTQIHQVVLNLCTNAYQAMQEDGGLLEVYLVEVRVNPDGSTDHLDLAAGDYLKMTIADTGHGMNERTMQRIFDPYFTTKEDGKGTGLGLAVVYGIVSAHKGAIQVKSAPGEGTTFEVFFPSIRSHRKQEQISYEKPSRGNESILFVDDEVTLVRVATLLLEKCGYRVTGLTHPFEALELFRADPSKYDLVITDMTMPRMTGDRLALAIKEIRPEMPIIITTGYSEKISREKAKMMGALDFVMKPFNYSDLTKRIRKAIDRKESDVVNKG